MVKDKSKKRIPKNSEMRYELLCVCCPVDCRLSGVFSPEEKERIAKFTCPTGWSYASYEQRLRAKMVTALIPIKGGTVPLRVRTSKPVPREKIYELLEELSKVTASVPVYEGQIIVHNICGFEVDIAAAEEYY